MQRVVGVMYSNIIVIKKWWTTWRTLPVFSWVKAAHLYRAGRFVEAEGHYAKGLQRFGSHPAQYCARLDYAYCLFKSRKFEEAEKQLRAVIAGLPKASEGYLRLARLQIWTGHSLDAAWTMRRAITEIGVTPELAATFLLSVVENGGPKYLLREALSAADKVEVDNSHSAHKKLMAARARLAFCEERSEGSVHELEKIAEETEAPFEAILLYAETLIDQGKIGEARKQLRRTLAAAPEHPRVLSMLAETYLQSGMFYEPLYAQQLATTACQCTNWQSPREMHILAESYYHVGDKIAALVTASKAKQVGSRLLGEYKGVKNLDLLIESLSTGTQA